MRPHLVPGESSSRGRRAGRRHTEPESSASKHQIGGDCVHPLFPRSEHRNASKESQRLRPEQKLPVRTEPQRRSPRSPLAHCSTIESKIDSSSQSASHRSSLLFGLSPERLKKDQVLVLYSSADGQNHALGCLALSIVASKMPCVCYHNTPVRLLNPSSQIQAQSRHFKSTYSCCNRKGIFCGPRQRQNSACP